MLNEDGISIEQLLSKNSDPLSDCDRNIRLELIKGWAYELVDRTCELYEQDSFEISCNFEIRQWDVLKVYFSRINGEYQIGLEHPFYGEYVIFRNDNEKGETIFEIIPKSRNEPKRLYNYQQDPNETYNSLVRIFLVAHGVVKRIEQENEEE